MTVPTKELSKRLQDLIINPLSKMERDDLCKQAADHIDKQTKAIEELEEFRHFAREVVDLLLAGFVPVDPNDLYELAINFKLITGLPGKIEKTQLLAGEQ